MKNNKYFYNDFAQKFDSKMNKYDLNKRLRIVFDILLHDHDLRNKKILDAGCGTGWFSQLACQKEGDVFSLDTGKNLLCEVAKKCNSQRVVGDVCNLPFDDGVFDYVISSEVIEHTENPKTAIRELMRVVKPNGVLILTTPNRRWHFAITLANFLKLRPYQGFENWLNEKEIIEAIETSGGVVEKKIGFHVIPFVSPILYPVIDFFDQFGEKISSIMLNLAFKIRIKNYVKL